MGFSAPTLVFRALLYHLCSPAYCIVGCGYGRVEWPVCSVFAVLFRVCDCGDRLQLLSLPRTAAGKSPPRRRSGRRSHGRMRASRPGAPRIQLTRKGHESRAESSGETSRWMLIRVGTWEERRCRVQLVKLPKLIAPNFSNRLSYHSEVLVLEWLSTML